MDKFWIVAIKCGFSLCRKARQSNMSVRYVFLLVKKLSIVTAISFVLSACGGGDTEQEKGLLALPQEPGTQNPDPTATPTVSPSPSVTPAPSVSATPTPTVSPTATPDPGSGAELSKPSLSVEVVGGAISANWSESDAEGYRLIYWPQDSVAPDEASVSGTSHETEALRSAWYLVMVEAYDAFGNGLFSDPVYVEVP